MVILQKPWVALEGPGCSFAILDLRVEIVVIPLTERVSEETGGVHVVSGAYDVGEPSQSSL